MKALLEEHTYTFIKCQFWNEFYGQFCSTTLNWTGYYSYTKHTVEQWISRSFKLMHGQKNQETAGVFSSHCQSMPLLQLPWLLARMSFTILFFLFLM